MIIKYVKKTCLVKKNIFQNLYTIKSSISTHELCLAGYSLAYDRKPYYTRVIFSRVGIFFKDHLAVMGLKTETV